MNKGNCFDYWTSLRELQLKVTMTECKDRRRRRTFGLKDENSRDRGRLKQRQKDRMSGPTGQKKHSDRSELHK